MSQINTSGSPRRIGDGQFRPLLVLSSLLALLTCGPALCSDQPVCCLECNIIVVTFDALRADHLGFYGYRHNTSPSLDAFAAEAHVFTDAQSQTGTTVPSFASMWTSKYPYVDDVLGYKPFALKEDEVTLAEVLRTNGYHTAAVIGHKYAGSRFGFAQGFDIFEDDHDKHEMAERTRARAEDVLARLESPFFLWIHFRQPHAIYNPTEELFREFYSGRSDTPTILKDGHEATLNYYTERREQVRYYSLMGSAEKLTSSMLRQYRALYDGNIKMGDEQFGVFLDTLERLGLDEQTVVIAGADHGESMGEHLSFDHNRLYWGILHTPLMVRLPDRRHAVHDTPVMNVDIFPSVLALLGIDHEFALRGRDLFEADQADRLQYAEYENRRSLKQGAHRLHVKQRSRRPDVRLFNVRTDPNETRNLKRRLRVLTSELKQALYAIGPLEVDSETMEQLRALGYIE